MGGKIRVLIVDDSPLVCEALKAILSSDRSIEVVGVARNGFEAVEKTMALKPSVITMDLEMPLMGGIEAVELIMEQQPTPIIIVSSIDPKLTIKALGTGAMDFVSITEDIQQIANNLIEKVKVASRVRPIRRINIKSIRAAVREAPKKAAACPPAGSNKVVAIGVSTGGPQALALLLSKLPHDLPAPVLIVQHISHGFVGGLVEWLRNSSGIEIKLAEAGETLRCSVAYLAPDDYHFGVEPDGKVVLTEDMGRHSTHVPSIDFMMESVAFSFGDRVLGVIMTGMGQDGVKGMQEIRKAGGRTLAQDESSSVIFGMNKSAIESNCIDRILPLDGLADAITRFCTEGRI